MNVCNVPCFPKIMASRYAGFNSVEQFIEDQENENTGKKTQQNVQKSSLSRGSDCSTTTVNSATSVLLFMVVNSTSLSAALNNHRPWPLQKLRTEIKSTKRYKRGTRLRFRGETLPLLA